ncbi:50S ribosomal protein L19 [Bienertia sinuspersici]
MAIKRDCPYYKTYWKMIDKRWNFQLHTDLHAAGCFLNPQYMYGSHDIGNDQELLKGVKNAISRLERDIEREVRALQQIHLYKDKMDSFATASAQKAITLMDPVKLLYRRLVVTTEVIVAVTVMMEAIIHLNIQLDSLKIHHGGRHMFKSITHHMFKNIIVKYMNGVEGKDNLLLNQLIVEHHGLDCQQCFPTESSGSNYFNDVPHIPYHGNYQSPPRRDCSLPIAGGYGSESNFPYHDNVQIFNHGTINYGGVHYHQPVYYGESSSQNEPSWMDGAGSYFFGGNERFHYGQDTEQEHPRHSFWY